MPREFLLLTPVTYKFDIHGFRLSELGGIAKGAKDRKASGISYRKGGRRWCFAWRAPASRLPSFSSHRGSPPSRMKRGLRLLSAIPATHLRRWLTLVMTPPILQMRF